MFYIFNKYTGQIIIVYTTPVVIIITRSDRFEF